MLFVNVGFVDVILKTMQQYYSVERVVFILQVILAVLTAWLLCAVLTVAGALPTERGQWGYLARADIKMDVLNQTAWIRFPYPCKYTHQGWLQKI